MVRQNVGRITGDLKGGEADERRHQECDQRVEHGPAEPHPRQRRDDRQRRQHVAARVVCVGLEDFAAEPPARPPLVADDEHVDQSVAAITPKLSAVTLGTCAPDSRATAVCTTSTMTRSSRVKMPHAASVSNLRWPYGCVRSAGRPRDAHRDEREHVGARVGERVEAVGGDADRAGPVAEHDLGPRDGEVEHQDVPENAGDPRGRLFRRSSRG